MSIMLRALCIDRDSSANEPDSYFTEHSLSSTSADDLCSLDAQIGQSLKDRLSKHSYREVRSLSVDVRKGIVTLHGVVSTFYYKQMAQESFRGCAGVETILNHIAVVTKR